MSRSFKWAEMTGPEVAALAKETSVAVIPVGCVEMHGPHLPTGTDAISAERMAGLTPSTSRPSSCPRSTTTSTTR